MVYHVKIYEQIEEDIYAGRAYCTKCNASCDFHLHKLKRKGSIFFITIISATAKRFIACDRCGAAKELTKNEFESIKKQQIEKLKCNQFPPDIVERDCNPHKVKMKQRIIKLFVSGCLAADIPFVMLLSCSEMSTEEVLHDLMSGTIQVMLPAMILTCLPFAISLKNFISACRKNKAYKFLHQ